MANRIYYKEMEMSFRKTQTPTKVLLTVAATGLVIAGAVGAQSPSGGTVEQLQNKLKELETSVTTTKKELATARKSELATKDMAALDINLLQVCIPKFKKTPVIDGRVDADEWAGATVIPAGVGAQNMGQPLMARPASLFYLGWDEENFYMAQKMPMREGEVPVRLSRAPKRDLVEAWETECELYIDRKTTGSIGSLCRWQFMGNAAGNVTDREDQYQIGQNWMIWDTYWTFKQSVSADGKWWDCEFAIPRKTVYQATPLKDGDRWWIGMAASLQQPWQWSGFYGWPITATFKNTAPAIRVFRPEAGVMTKRMTFDLEVTNTTDRPINATAIGKVWDPGANEVVAEKQIPISLAPGKTFKTTVDESAASAKDEKRYQFAIMVIEDGKSLYTWNRFVAYGDPANKIGLVVEAKKEPFPLKVSYYPIKGYANVTVDRYDLAQRDKVKSCKFEISPKGGAPIVSGVITNFEYESGSTGVKLPTDMKPGTYQCQAKMLDASGNVLISNTAEFERKDAAKEFPWIGNKIGEQDVLPKIFQPVSVKGNTIYGFQKEITLTGMALPRTVKAADVELLAAPMQIRGVADGKEFTVSPTATTAKKGIVSKTQVNYTGSGVGGPIKIDVSYRLDFDGVAKVVLKVAPTNTSAKLDRLQVVIPFRGEAATYYLANGANMRLSNQAGLIPGKDKLGRVWDSTMVKFQRMTTGSFVPIVHVGNLSSGITWFADSDQGWWPSSKEPAIEMVRTKEGNLNLIFNLASEKVSFTEPREIVFGLSTVPTRKTTGHKPSMNVVGFGYTRESGRWDPEKTPTEVYARMYPDNPTKYKEWSALAHERDQLSEPYTEQTQADYFEPEYSYFANEFGAVFSKNASDCRIYWTEKFIRDCDIDGYYLDNMFCRVYEDPLTTAAYYLPDGRVQPAFDLWQMREYMRRLRNTFEKYRPNTMITIHNTDFQFAPVCTYADLVMGGENPLPSKGTPDYMDMWPREWMDVMFNQNLWGYNISHLNHYGSDTFVDEEGKYDQTAAFKTYRGMSASMLIHGVEFFHGIDYKNFLGSYYRMFKMLPGETQFIPSWKANGLFKVADADPDIDVAMYRKDKAILVIVANYSKSKRRAEVWMDFPKILPTPGNIETRQMFDLETGEGNGLGVKDITWAWGTLKPNSVFVEVEPRDFRVFVIGNLPVAQGAGF